VLAVGADIVGVQTTSAANVAARVRKLTASAALPILRQAGVRILVHGWAKKGRLWRLREVDLSNLAVNGACLDPGGDGVGDARLIDDGGERARALGQVARP
jgi:hypothetical protein